MSGLLALLDDVAAIAKLAATQLDDITAQATKAGAKAAGVVIDDAAVTPKYVTNLPAARELPIISKIARASFFNKLVILLPAALLLDAFVPQLVTPLLMLGGAYLCFEGAEKVWHLLLPHAPSETKKADTLDAALLEKRRVKGAIKTDFILSAEIMAISLAAIDADSIWMQGVILFAVAVGITTLVYGVVALLVKADDIGLRLSQTSRMATLRAFGRAIVKHMPKFMAFIAAVGTAAMLWVGGNIIMHGLYDLGWKAPYQAIHGVAESVGHGFGALRGAVEWLVVAGLDGAAAFLLGSLCVLLIAYVVGPLTRLFSGDKKEAASP